MLRALPPGIERFSSTVTGSPRSRSSWAADMPPTPPPRTTTHGPFPSGRRRGEARSFVPRNADGPDRSFDDESEQPATPVTATTPAAPSAPRNLRRPIEPPGPRSSLGWVPAPPAMGQPPGDLPVAGHGRTIP